MLLSSATGGASRRIADALAGRSLAAIFILSRLALAAVAHQANPQRSQGSPPRAAKRRGLFSLPPLGAAGFIRSRQFLTVGTKR
jgi:hypothetical protein